MSGITKVLSNEKFYSATKGAALAIYATTALKAAARPAFIYADKKNDKETKKYTATKELLYQVICLGITAAILPQFKKLGLALSKKHLKEVAELADIKVNKAGLEKLEHAVHDVTLHNKKGFSEKEITAIKTANGGVELGSFVGSILGLTIIAPQISHMVLHPVMKALGMEKKDGSKDIGKPQEVFVADANVPAQSAPKVNTVV